MLMNCNFLLYSVPRLPENRQALFTNGEKNGRRCFLKKALFSYKFHISESTRVGCSLYFGGRI